MNKLWEAKINPSFILTILTCFAFLSLFCIAIYYFLHTELENYLSILFFYLLLTGLKLFIQAQKKPGRIAVFVEEQLIYWERQRFELVRLPFLSPFVVILSIRSKIDHHSKTIVIFSLQLSEQSWRSFHFALRHLIAESKKQDKLSHRFD